jgi:ABC-type transporter Mla maintaining outer membrane lipid asymmetry ATPase subunit MlaF
MGHSFDVGGLINNQTLYENFRLLLDYHDYLEPAERFDYIVQMMKWFQLENQKHLRPAFISSSARKAACVLRAFSLKPEVVILDNPTQGMSMEHIPNLVKLIKEHQDKYSLKYVVISSDDVGLISQLPGRIVSVTATGLAS